MSNPAPGPLETVRSFVNTLDIDDGIERCRTRPSSRVARRARPAGDGAAAARRARPPPTCAARSSCARRCARTCSPITTSRSPAGAAATLDAAARRARLTLRFTGADETALEPAAGGVDGALGRLLAIVARGDRGRHVAAPEGLPGRHLPVGVLRHVAQPLGGVVRHARVRQPREGARLSRAHAGGRRRGAGTPRARSGCPRAGTSARARARSAARRR